MVGRLSAFVSWRFTARTLAPVLTILAFSCAQDVDECNVPQEASGTSGLLQRVIDLKATIGYAGLDSVVRVKAEEDEFDTCILNVAQMKNKWGRVVSPTADGAQAAVRSRAAAFLDSSCPGFGLCAEVHDGPDADVWPLSTLTYLVVPTNTTEEEDGCDAMKTVYDYVKWILTSSAASDIAKEQAMATMPNIIAEQAVAILDEMRCRGADGVTRLVKDRTSWAERLEGGGSSLQGNLQTKLTNAYFQESFIAIAYTASSSGTGRAALRDRQLHFAGSDSILDMSDPEFARRGMKMIPAFAAAVALVYNLDGAEGLVLTRQAVAGVFTGTVTSWANDAIRAENPDAFLANDAIVRVVRASTSGTTSVLTKAIYAFAGLPAGAQQDYSLHPLGGSGLPTWPVAALPYADGATCRFRSCIRKVCEPGQRLDVPSESCLPCPQGYFSTERGQHEECEPCAAGSYSNSEGNSKCAKCDEFQYQDALGQRACKACPANTRRFFVEVSVGGAIVQQETPGETADECKCVPGHWLPAAVNQTQRGGAACVPCPDGATCAGFRGNQQQIPAPKKDYWGDPHNPGRFIECRTDACRGGYLCEEGHTGRLCAAPEEGHFTVGRLWYPKCPAGSAGRAALVAGTVLCVLGLWFKLRTLCFANLDAVSVVVGLLQALYVISRMRLRWHPAIEAATAVLALFNFDVGFFSWHCAAPGWDGLAVFMVQLFLPFVLAGLSCGVFYLRWFTEMRDSATSRDKNVRSKGVLRNPNYLPDSGATYVQGRLLSFILIMYHTLVMYAAAPFVCASEPDGRTAFVELLPEIECGSSAHGAMRVVAILYIILVLIPFPIYLATTLQNGLRKDVLNVYDFMEQFGFMYLKFHLRLPWWELVMLARRALLTLVLVTVSVPMIQAVLAILIVNVAMCLHLVYRPLAHPPAERLETAGLFCALVLAVCGMLFFPSLDKAVECVGSSNLPAVGEQCRANHALKATIAMLLVVLFVLLGLAACVLSAMEMHARHLAEDAARRIKALSVNQKTRRVGSAVAGAEEGAEGGAVRVESAATAVRAVAKEQTWHPVWRSPKWWHGPAYRLGLRREAPWRAAEGVVDPYTLKLCHMVQGYHLHWWQQRVSHLGRSSATRWQRVRESIELHREELAYLHIDESLARFATIFDHVSGFHVNDDFANKLRQVSRVLPLLIDWLAHADTDLRRDFSVAVQSLTLYARKSLSRAFHDVVLTEYRTPVAHWLMSATDEQRAALRVVFTAISAASGLGLGKLVNLGLHLALHDDRAPDARDASPPASPTSVLRRPSSQSPTPAPFPALNSSPAPAARRGSAALAHPGTARAESDLAESSLLPPRAAEGSLSPSTPHRDAANSGWGAQQDAEVPARNRQTLLQDGTEITELLDDGTGTVAGHE